MDVLCFWSVCDDWCYKWLSKRDPVNQAPAFSLLLFDCLFSGMPGMIRTIVFDMVKKSSTKQMTAQHSHASAFYCFAVGTDEESCIQ